MIEVVLFLINMLLEVFTMLGRFIQFLFGRTPTMMGPPD
jgi:hypothetical protein